MPVTTNSITVGSRTRLLSAAMHVIRRQGYAGATVDDICQAAALTKGSFFHHFKGKEDAALAAVQHWNEVTGALFAAAPYQQIADPRDRILAYIDFRMSLLEGELPEFTCLLGTLVQEAYATMPSLRMACEQGIALHAGTLVHDLAEAQARYAPGADWSPESLALYTQASIQGAFILAKAAGSAQVAKDCIAHLRRYVGLLLESPIEPAALARHGPAASRTTSRGDANRQSRFGRQHHDPRSKGAHP
jgi:TetR/AcrR family transcriptional regulator, transcriptional repressor for nem operon